MRRNVIIIIFIIILMLQALIPLKVNAEPASSNGEKSIFDPNVTWEWEYEEHEYGLFIPSNADKIEAAPMIVWLHGNGNGQDLSEAGLLSTPIPGLFSNWQMEGFSAFILCPQSRASWQSPDRGKVISIMKQVMEQYPIDPNNVVIMGHSAGAVGALIMAVHDSEYFSKAAVMAALSYGGHATIPVKCYVGTLDNLYMGYMSSTLEPTYGKENCIRIPGAGHNNVNKIAFYEDTGEHMGIGGNGRSDLVEWLFDGVTINEISYTDIESPTTGLNARTGMILEPAVEFFTFITDSIMSVFSGVMKQDNIEPVMVDEEQIGTLSTSGKAATSLTISDMQPYETASGNLDFIKYPNFPFSLKELFAGEIELLDVNFLSTSNKNADWLNIRKVISQWYQILRMIAIIGLLSVLIYTGIKIILSSNAKDKAKYKELLVNWFVAVFLVFSMHYIMAFILSVIEQIPQLLPDKVEDVINVNAGGVSFTTNLIGIQRFQMQIQHFTSKIGHLIIYIALVVYTFKFTFIYFKRFLKMAFLTLAAPVVALTYPIDKANDGEAQGFQMWLKEYIFNALLQPIHLILYYILLSSAMQLAVTNPIYGIVVLGFMSNAEKLLKKIFGFDKAKAGTVEGLTGAFSTGVITASIMNFAKDPLHLGFGKKNIKSSGQKAGAEDYYNEERIEFYDDTTNEDDLLLMNIRGGASNSSSLSFKESSDSDLNSREEMLQILNEYESAGGYLEDIGDLSLLENEELRDLIQERVIDNPSLGANNIFMPIDVNEGVGEEQESAWKKFKDNHPVAGGLANVAKTIAKPVWDVEKDVKYNSSRIAGNVIKGAVGMGIGVAAAAVQAGVSITDGKYNPVEGVATVAAGVTGVSGISKTIEGKKELTPEDKEAVRKFSEEWFNRDDIISRYNTDFPGEGKKRRERAAKNYVTRGITDVNDQRQAMIFADLIQKERGLDQEEADKIAVATLQYRQDLVKNNSYNVLFDRKQRDNYTAIKADSYTGSASKDAIRRLHEDLIENVRDFDRANR